MALPTHTLTDLLETYAAEYFPTQKPRTRYQHERLYAWFSRELGDIPLQDLTPLVLRTWKVQLLTRYKPGSVRTYMAQLNVVLNVAVKEYGWLVVNPLSRVPQPPAPPGRTRFLNDEERWALLRECQASRNPALFTIVMVAIATGMRKGEVLGLRWAQVDFERSFLRLSTSKTGLGRPIPLASIGTEALREWCRGRRHDVDWVFPRADGRKPLYVERSWQTAKRRAQLEDFHFNDLRHTFASYFAMSGATLRDIMEVLGHKTTAMSTRYSHLTQTHTLHLVEKMAKQFLAPKPPGKPEAKHNRRKTDPQ